MYLTYIRESIDLVEQYTREGEGGFTTDLRTQDAVLRCMETLADAAAHLPDDLKARHPQIRWRQVGKCAPADQRRFGEVELLVSQR